ncbi:MAG: type II secretion system protein [Woeseiaceae bacterium]
MGFTMIELVTVIVILAIIAAFAVPKFADLRSSARQTTLQGMVGSMKSAATIAHSVSLTQGLGANDPIQMQGQAIAMVGAYPDAQGMAEAVQLTLGDDFQIQYFSNTAFIVYATGAPGWTSCGFAYIRAFPPSIPVPRYLGPFTANCR